ncbi:MAG: regulatory protein RecX [Lachnospiraceae bacterium]|nr:regulatory protein RecX [Lachnospiraceae bacterium]
MIITEISPWKKGRQLIVIDHENAFALYDSEVRKYNLKEGEEIDSVKYADILENVLIKRAKSRTLHLLDRFDKTEKELRDKLKEDMYPEEAIDAAVEAAKKGRFLDDRRFTAQYIHDKSARHSIKRIEMDLRRKGIDREVLSEALREFEEDQIENGEDRQQELIDKLIKKKLGSLRELTPETEAGIYRYLTGRGFEYGAVKKSLERYFAEQG